MQTTGLSGRYCDLHGLRGETRDAPVCPHFRPEKPPIRKFPGRKHDHAGLPTGHFFIPGVARLFCPSAPGRALAAAIRLGPMQTQPLASRFRDLQGVRREPPEDPLVHPFLEGALTNEAPEFEVANPLLPPQLLRSSFWQSIDDSQHYRRAHLNRHHRLRRRQRVVLSLTLLHRQAQGVRDDRRTRAPTARIKPRRPRASEAGGAPFVRHPTYFRNHASTSSSVQE